MKPRKTEQQGTEYVMLTPKLRTVGALVKRELTLPELVQAIDVLRAASQRLTETLVKLCPRCDDCDEDCDDRFYVEEQIFEDGDKKLRFAPQDMEDVSLTDLPIYLLDDCYEAELCLTTLGALLGDGTVIRLAE